MLGHDFRRSGEFSFAFNRSVQCADGTDAALVSWCADRNDIPPSALGKPLPDQPTPVKARAA
jgi:hypothetical protein